MAARTLQVVLFLVVSRFVGADCRQAFRHVQESASEGANYHRILLVDARGPTRSTGDGVRTMGMIMDMQSGDCTVHTKTGFNVTIDVLAAIPSDAPRSAWTEEISSKYLSMVRFWQPEDYPAGNVVLHNYQRIIIGAKLDTLYTDGRGGVVLDVLEDMLQQPAKLKNRTSVYWDDVPFARCQFRKEASEICPRASQIVDQFAKVSHKFHVLTTDDQNSMLNEMKVRKLHSVEVSKWPMRIQNMAQVLPAERFVYSGGAAFKSRIVMMGNHHAVNVGNVDALFDSGAMAALCREVRKHNPGVMFLFLGEVVTEVELKMAEHQKKGERLDCVEYRKDFISEELWTQDILPHTRAIFNPMFSDTSSGISVKIFESIMMGIPFITSSFAMHGLANEIEECSHYPLPTSSSPEALVNFVANRVLDNTTYKTFAKKFSVNSALCIAAQDEMYPVSHVC